MRLGRSKPAPEAPRGSIDHPPAGAVFAEAVLLSGWVAFDGAPTARVEAWLDGASLGRARLGLPRPDIAAIRPGPDAAVAGFELRAGLDPPGERRQAQLRVVAESTAGERHEFEPVPVLLGGGAGPAPAAEPRRRPESHGGGRRVLAFTNVLTLGGASIYLFELLREARRLGRVEPTVATVIDGPLRGELEESGVPVHLLGPLALDDPDAYLDRIEELAAWAAGERFELVLVNTATGLTLPGADLAARLGIPAVWSIHESFHPALLWEGLAPALRSRAEAALADAAFAIFQAEATREIYLDSIPPERSATIPYGFDLAPIEAVRDGFDRARARQEAGVPEDAELIICVGTVEPRKAQVQLTQAFELIAERHPSAQLAFVGSDDQWGSAALAERIAASPQRERMRMVPRTREVQPWYGMADLLVCASDVESLPRTVLEAMAWGTPVLATAIFGLPELIEHGVDGWLCEPGDVRALSAGLEAVLAGDREDRRRVGAAGRQRVLERHDLGGYTRRVAEIFDLLAAGGEVSPALPGKSAGPAS